MPRHRYFYAVNGKRVEELVDGKWLAVQDRAMHRSHIVISDSMDATWNPATGRKYDSKSAYYRDTRAAGCEILGNEKQALKGPPRTKHPEPVETTIERLNQQKGWNL